MWNSKLPTLICTDVEPDDLAALALLLRHCEGDVLIVVGEHQNVRDKVAVLRWCLQQVFQQSPPVTIVAGSKSDRGQFPVPPEVPLSADCEELQPDQIRQFVQNRECNVFSLKPPRDLLQVYHNCPQAFFHCHLYAYASFNVRCLLKTVSEDTILNFWNSFASALLFESFFVFGEANAITNADLGRKKYVAGLQELVQAWNQHLLQTSTGKVLDSVSANPDSNLLLSDIALVIFLLHHQEFENDVVCMPVSVSFNPTTKYTQTELNLSSTMQMPFVQSDNQADVRQAVITMLCNYFTE